MAQDPEYERRVREDFAKQAAMAFLGARMTRVEPGLVEVELPFRAELGQQHGFFHAGLLSTIADSAGGYAGYTLMPARTEVLTVEFKMNLLAPAKGVLAIARGRVVRAGRTLTVCDLEVDVLDGERRKLCARGMQTLICRSQEELQRGGGA